VDYFIKKSFWSCLTFHYLSCPTSELLGSLIPFAQNLEQLVEVMTFSQMKDMSNTLTELVQLIYHGFKIKKNLFNCGWLILKKQQFCFKMQFG
jgi:hypothetical protein